MRKFLQTALLVLCIPVAGALHAQGFPNPALLSTGQGPLGTLDPIWLVSDWYSTPPNPIGLAYTSAVIDNNCAPGSWVNPATLPPPENNGNWISNPNYPCTTNLNIGYIVFRLTVTLPAACNGVSIAAAGNYTLYLSGYSDNTISGVYVNGSSTGQSGGNFMAGGELNMTLTGPWTAGTNYVDVVVYNFFNNNMPNPYGLLLVANATVSYANGCPPAITGDSILCRGDSTILWVPQTGYNYLWSTGANSDSITVSPSSSTSYSVTVTNAYGFRDSSVIDITVNALPVVSIAPPTTSICAGNSASLTASGGTAYVWSNGANSTSITVSPGGTLQYSVTATNSNNCTATASSTVTVDTLPIAAVNPDTAEICDGGSVSLTASGGTIYAWNNGSNTAFVTVSPNSTSIFTVTVTNSNNCSATATATITVNQLPPANIIPATPQICFGDSVTLMAGTGVNYIWSNAANTNAITVSPGSTSNYSVTVTGANGCTAATTSTVTVNPLPVVAINPASPAICLNDSVKLTATGGATYSWSNGASTAATTVLPSVSTTYSVTATDLNMCTAAATDSVTVNSLPVAVINPASAQICQGTSTMLAASGGINYVWSNAATTPSISVSPATTAAYSVTVTDVNSCTGSTTATVTVIPTMILNIIVTNVSCYGENDGSTNLSVASGQPPYSFSWNTGDSSENLNNLGQGNYSVIVTDNAGCTAADSTQINQPPVLALSDSSINPTCPTLGDNGSINLTVTGGTAPYQYEWAGAAGGTDVQQLGPGNYAVTVSDAHQCTVSSTFTLAYIYDFSITASPGTTIKLGGNTTLGYTLSGNTGNYTVEWSPDEALSCSACASPLAAPTVTTEYRVEISNAAGCWATDTVTVTVMPDYSVFVPNVFSPNGDGHNDLFRVYGNTNAVTFFEIEIFNRWGEEVFASNDVNFYWDGTYKGARQEPGVFVWLLKSVFLDGHSEGPRNGTLTLLR